MKKLLVMTLLVFVLFTLVACGGNGGIAETGTQATPPPANPQQQEQPPAQNETENDEQTQEMASDYENETESNPQQAAEQPEPEMQYLTRSEFIYYQCVYDNTLTGHLPVRKNRASLGTAHTLVIDNNGIAWGMGSNRRGALGVRDHYISFHLRETYELQPVKLLQNVALVRTQGRYSFAITNGGSLWKLDSSISSALAELIDYRFLGYPIRIMDNIVDIQIGWDHFLALSSNGEVWAWGDNSSGQVQSPREAIVLGPRVVMENVIQIKAGPHSSFAITESGDLYVWGCLLNQGVASDLFPATHPRVRIDGFGDIVSLYHTGDLNMTAVGADGAAMLVRYRDLVSASAEAYVFEPTRWTWDDSNVTEHIMFIGSDTFMLQDTGLLQGIGSNRYGLLNPANPSSSSYRSPITIREDVAYFAAGGPSHAGPTHAFMIDKTGQMWVWGRNHEGQLGLGHTSTTEEFTMLQFGLLD